MLRTIIQGDRSTSDCRHVCRYFNGDHNNRRQTVANMSNFSYNLEYDIYILPTCFGDHLKTLPSWFGAFWEAIASDLHHCSDIPCHCRKYLKHI